MFLPGRFSVSEKRWNGQLWVCAKETMNEVIQRPEKKAKEIYLLPNSVGTDQEAGRHYSPSFFFHELNGQKKKT